MSRDSDHHLLPCDPPPYVFFPLKHLPLVIFNLSISFPALPPFISNLWLELWVIFSHQRIHQWIKWSRGQGEMSFVPLRVEQGSIRDPMIVWLQDHKIKHLKTSKNFSSINTNTHTHTHTDTHTDTHTHTHTHKQNQNLLLVVCQCFILSLYLPPCFELNF